MCRESIETLPKTLNGLRMYREDREHKNLSQWIDLAVEKLLRSNLEILLEEICFELLSRCYREGIEQLSRRKSKIFQGRKNTQDECNKIATQTSIQAAC